MAKLLAFSERRQEFYERALDRYDREAFPIPLGAVSHRRDGVDVSALKAGEQEAVESFRP